MPPYLPREPSFYRVIPMATSILVLISLVPSFPPNETMISIIMNYLQSFLPSPNGISTFRECPTLSPSSPTIRTCPILKIPANSLVNRHTGLFSYKTLTSFGRYSQVLNSLPLTHSLDTTKLTPPPTTPILPLSLNPRSSML